MDTLLQYKSIVKELDAIDPASVTNAEGFKRIADFLAAEKTKLSDQLSIDHADMKVKKKAFEATPTDELNNTYFEAQSKYEETEKRVQRVAAEHATKGKAAEEAAAAKKRADKLKAQEAALLEKIFGGSYGSEMEAQLEEMADYQTLTAADATADRDKWIEAHRAFTAGVASLASSTTLTHDFIAAVNADPNAWVAMNGTVQQIHKGLTGGFHHFDLVWRAHVPSAQFPRFGAKHMTMLDTLIKSIFEDAKNVEKIRRQHAYITDLCKRGEAAQHYIHLKLQDQLIPDQDKCKALLADTTVKLRTERRRLIEIKLDGVDGAIKSAASTSALAAIEEADKAATVAAADTTNAEAAAASEAAAATAAAATVEAEKVAAEAVAARAAMESEMTMQLDAMRAKLAVSISSLFVCRVSSMLCSVMLLDGHCCFA
jgi:hypothetical protein